MSYPILFVEDDPALAKSVAASLRAHGEFSPTFADDGATGLSLLERHTFDVIVASSHVGGETFLNEVMRRNPQAVRIVWAEPENRRRVLSSARSSHQFLARPCDTDTLTSTLRRACALKRLLNDEALRSAMARMKSLPSLRHIYYKIHEELSKEDPSTKRVADLIASDLAMMTKILQLVNAAFFGLSYQVESPQRAVVLLGLDTVQSLVLSADIFSQLKPRGYETFVQALWAHSMATSAMAKRIAEDHGAAPDVVCDSMVAGLLHDVGQLVLATNRPNGYRKVIERARAEATPLVDVERAAFGTSHAEVGAYLLGLWGLPESIVQAVAFHHAPRECLGQTFSPLTAVHVASNLHEQTSIRTGPPSDVDGAYLEELDMAQVPRSWRRICNETVDAPTEDATG